MVLPSESFLSYASGSSLHVNVPRLICVINCEFQDIAIALAIVVSAMKLSYHRSSTLTLCKYKTA